MVLNSVSFIRWLVHDCHLPLIILISSKGKVDQPNSKRSGGRRGVSRQILLAALAVRRRPVFEIVALAISSNQCRQRSTPRRPQRSCPLFCQNLFRIQSLHSIWYNRLTTSFLTSKLSTIAIEQNKKD